LARLQLCLELVKGWTPLCRTALESMLLLQRNAVLLACVLLCAWWAAALARADDVEAPHAPAPQEATPTSTPLPFRTSFSSLFMDSAGLTPVCAHAIAMSVRRRSLAPRHAAAASVCCTV
jgi:hypothetical protein